MEVLAGLLAALLIALVITAAFSAVTGPRSATASDTSELPEATDAGIGFGLAWFFILLFLFVWAASLWVTPVGPAVWGIAWVPLLFVGIFFALLVAALVTPTETRRVPPRSQPATSITTERSADVGWPNAFVWTIIGLLVLVILATLTM